MLTEFQIGAPSTRIWTGGDRMLIGLKTGRCEVWSITDQFKCKKISEGGVGRGASAILNVEWVHPFVFC